MDPEIPLYTEQEFEMTGEGLSYRGNRDENGCCVWAGGYPLPVRLDLRNHSPTGFCWGYCGSGPAQLALALLAHAVGDVLAEEHYQQFKRAVVGRLPHECWIIAQGDVVDWVRHEILADYGLTEERWTVTELPSQAVPAATDDDCVDYCSLPDDAQPTVELPE